MDISEVTYRKWKKCVKLSAGDTELVITRSVGPDYPLRFARRAESIRRNQEPVER